MISGTAVLLSLVALVPLYVRSSPIEKGCDGFEDCQAPLSHSWGAYSPFFPVSSIIDAATPADCRLTFGLVYSRHGARYPTKSKSEKYEALVRRLQGSVQEYPPGYEFIKNFRYELGADNLTPFGEIEMVDSGAAFYRRYRDLAGETDPFIRASGSGRVIVSADNFTQGFFHTQGKGASGPIGRILVVPEKAGFNNSMEHGTCPAFEDGPAAETAKKNEDIWSKIWATPIMQRLNKDLPGANLTLEDAIRVMDLCPFNSVVTPNEAESDFCKLFSRDEWQGYDYLRSLGKWYGYGNGNKLGATQGVGYVNEIIARLTGTAVHDDTSTNQTLDSSPETFPLKRKLYADFSHDNSMISVYAALGLYNATADLPPTRIVSPWEAHGFSASWTVPFASRMYVEKMQCGQDEDELVRILVNDRVVPLQNCGADKLGRCKLGAFVDSLSFARQGGLWNRCRV